MPHPTPVERVRRFFDAIAPWLELGVAELSDDVDDVLAQARERVAAMTGELPYVEELGHTMRPSMLSCASMLAIWEVLRERGLDVHDWGRAILALPVRPEPPDEESEEAGRNARARLAAEAAGSQRGVAPNEFVFEVLPVEGKGRSAMNITSCAICHLFARHDAMDLVPYMCASDDVQSAASDHGLRRTGTIALGATHCDFRFERGGDPLPLAGQYPDRIRSK